MHRNLHWLLLVVALALLVTAVAAEHPFFLSHSTAGHSAIFNLHALAALLKEIAFALLIALVISIGIERQARDADAKLAAEQRQRIAEDVFRGVFSNELPPNYVEQVIRTTLKPNVIRHYVRSLDTLSRVTEPEEIHPSGRLGPLLQYHRVISSSIENISAETVRHTLRISLPIFSPDLARWVRLKRFVVGGRAFGEADVEGMRATDERESRVTYSYDVDLRPREPIEVLWETTHLKELSDSEVYGSALPTMRWELAVRFDEPNMIFDARNNGASPARRIFEDSSRGAAQWVVDGPMLPNESIIVWWHKRPVG